MGNLITAILTGLAMLYILLFIIFIEKDIDTRVLELAGPFLVFVYLAFIVFEFKFWSTKEKGTKTIETKKPQK